MYIVISVCIDAEIHTETCTDPDGAQFDPTFKIILMPTFEIIFNHVKIVPKPIKVISKPINIKLKTLGGGGGVVIFQTPDLPQSGSYLIQIRETHFGSTRNSKPDFGHKL